MQRRKPISKRPKAPRKKAVLYADSLWSQIVRRRSETCVSPAWEPWAHRGEYVPCGRPVTDAAHGIDRGAFGTRWDLRNGWPSCWTCNCQVYARPQSRKRLWYEWIEAQWGPALTAEMRAKARGMAKSVDVRDVTAALEAVLHTGAADPGVNVEQRRCA